MPLFGSRRPTSPDYSFEGQMRSVVESILDPYSVFSGNALAQPRSRRHPGDMHMMPFGIFPPMPVFNMDNLFMDFNNMGQGGNCHSFTSRSVMTMASGPDGRPQVYQETMSTTTAPGGVKETKKTVSDSRSGLKKMAIGHHIGERAHILEREHNVHSGTQEERQEFINLDEEEAESFNNEWETRTRRPNIAIGGSHYGAHGHRTRPDHRQLALPEASGSRYSNPSRWTPSSRRNLKLPSTSKTYNSPQILSSESSGDTKSTAKPVAAESSTNVTRNRKRERTSDTKVCKKRHSAPDSRD